MTPESGGPPQASVCIRPHKPPQCRCTCRAPCTRQLLVAPLPQQLIRVSQVECAQQTRYRGMIWLHSVMFADEVSATEALSNRNCPGMGASSCKAPTAGMQADR